MNFGQKQGGEGSPEASPPVLITAFNRVDSLSRVVAAVGRAKTPRVYFAVDGPRADRPGEAEAVMAVQRALLDSVDWACDVKTLFRDENLGCARAVSGAIDWFFSHEESGIILEDDCVPGPDFFAYCRVLLDRYADDPRVMHVGGSSLTDIDDAGASYFMSLYGHVWGWATWKDSWAAFSLQDDRLEENLPEVLARFSTDEERRYWRSILINTFAGEIDSWAYRWAYAIWKSGGVFLYPAGNMVKNVGFGNNATHTRPWTDYRGVLDRPIDAVGSITHPTSSWVRRDLDTEIFRQSYRKPLLPVRALKGASRMLSFRDDIADVGSR